MKKRILTLALCLALVLSITIPGTWATTEEPTDPTATTETTVTTDPTGETKAPDATDPTESTGANDPTDPSEETTTPPCEYCGQTEDHAEDCLSRCTCDPKPAEGEPHSEGCPLYVEKTFDVEAAYEYVMGLSTVEEVNEYLASLTEEEYAALEAYAVSKEEPVEVKSKTFTAAGPFMPAVSVASSRMFRMMRAAAVPERVDNEGVYTSKTVTPNEDGTYTLRLESYVTGTTTTTTVTSSTPVDIVLVLDQSGSMAYNFNGDSTNTNSERRQYAMKEAVQAFIGEVAKKYDSEQCDNRMAIVTFGSNASTLQGWTFVDETGEATLKGKVAGLPDSPSGATNAGAGMQPAESLMGGGFSYNGANTNRQKVVIMFTDGVPTTSSEFSTNVANTAISSAYNLKQAGVTVYSIGIFNGVNPGQLHGDKIDYTLQADVPCDGSVGSAWGASVIQAIFGDVRGVDIAAGNRFLNYLSSNFKGATEIGIKSTSKRGATCWEITKNFDRTASNYYLTATDSASLNQIFQTISQNIQSGSASVQMGTDTVVKDVISDYFELPDGANANSIKVMTATYKQDGTWNEAVKSDLTATVEGKTVTVTGFDFSQNYCSTDEGRQDGDNNQPGDFYGRKLIIEIPIVVRNGFLGGNDVPTNTTDSAVVSSDGTVMEQFEVPTTNVTIATPEVNAVNATVYEGGSIDASSLYTLPTYSDENDWKDDFVTISGVVSGASADGKVSPADCTEYTVIVTYTPTSDGSTNSFKLVEAVSNEGKATVHVLKPTVTATVNDVQCYYGESHTLGTGVNSSINVNWTDKTEDHNEIPNAIGTAPYTGDDLTLAYSVDGKSEPISIGKTDVDVTAKVMNGANEIPATITTNCSYGCDNGATDGKYTVHVKTCQLTVKKTGGASGEPYVFTVYKDGAKYTEASVVGNGSVTICELPVGTYTIEEDTGWSWRFNANNGNGASLTATSPTGEITCTNTARTDKVQWLNGFSDVVTNIFKSN